jgi:phosphatidyl-myo-inositol dimannoside synthase
MKLLFVTRKTSPTKGGMERVSRGLFESLSRVISISLLEPPEDFPNLLSVPILLIRTFVRLTKKDIDLIYLQDSMLAPLILLAKMHGIPVVVSAHGLDVIYPNPIYSASIRCFLGKADRIMCVSQATMAACIEKGVPPSKCIVIPNGLDVSKWISLVESTPQALEKRPEHKPIILSVGRLVKRKGFSWFATCVMPLILTEIPNAQYVIVGDGKMRREIEETIRKSGLDGHVRLEGKVSEEKLVEAYRSASVMVSPNIPVDGDMEGFGVSNIEAGFFGVPVVATRLDGIPDAVIEGVTGILVDPLKPDDFAKAACGILRGEIAFNKEGIKDAIRWKFDWNQIALGYKEEFERILRGKLTTQRKA